MVWHAFMLNPRTYLEDCIRFTTHKLWRTTFPWQHIYDSIDNESFEYTQEDTVTWERATRHFWDPLQDEGLKRVDCPKCGKVSRVPWTNPPASSTYEALEAYLTNDTGFAGSAFQHSCMGCGFLITHEKLRVAKFCNDAHNVMKVEIPLAGTILNIWGEPGGELDTTIVSRC